MPIASIDRQVCTGCGECVRVCPMDVIRLDPGGQAATRYPADCQSCISCEAACPVGAIFVTPWWAREIPKPW